MLPSPPECDGPAAAWAEAAMAADAAAVSLCGRIARPPFLALVADTGPVSG